MILKALIVDDEYPIRQELRYLLDLIGNIEVVGEAASAAEAMKLILALEYDVVFLDISLPGINGLEMAEKIKELPRRPRIVFITAYDNYALEAFDVNAVDYILKPIDLNRLRLAIKKVEAISVADDKALRIPSEPSAAVAKSAEGHRAPERLVTERNGRMLLVDVDDVLYAFILGDKVYLKVGSEKLPTRYTLKELEEKLVGRSFYRTHRSFMVNINRIKEIQPLFNGTWQLIMNDKEKSEVPVSRNHVSKLRSLLE